MVKLTHQWEGPPDHHDRYSSKLHQECSGVEDETQRAVVQRKPSLTLRLQRRYTRGIEEGEQESQSLPAILACTSPQR